MKRAIFCRRLRIWAAVLLLGITVLRSDACAAEHPFCAEFTQLEFQSNGDIRLGRKVSDSDDGSWLLILASYDERGRYLEMRCVMYQANAAEVTIPSVDGYQRRFLVLRPDGMQPKYACYDWNGQRFGNELPHIVL